MRWGCGVDAAHGKDMPPLLPLHPSLNVPFWPFHSLLGAFNGIEVDYRLLSYGSTGTGDFDPLETAHCSPQISSFQQASLTHISMLACVALGNYNKVKGVVRKPFKARNVDKCRPCESALVAYGADQTTRKKDCATAHMLQPLIIGRTRFKAQWGRVNVTNPRYHLSHSGSLQPQCETLVPLNGKTGQLLVAALSTGHADPPQRLGLRLKHIYWHRLRLLHGPNTQSSFPPVLFGDLCNKLKSVYWL